MQPEQGHPPTQLFLVRLWVEPLADDPGEVRIQVKHVLSGETRYFRAWPELEAFLLAKLPRPEAGSGPEASNPR